MSALAQVPSDAYGMLLPGSHIWKLWYLPGSREIKQIKVNNKDYNIYIYDNTGRIYKSALFLWQNSEIYQGELLNRKGHISLLSL